MFENLKGLLVKETLWVNALRSFATGIVYMILMLCLQPRGMHWYTPLLFPIFMPVFLLMFYIIAQILRIVNLGGVGNIICMLFSVPGDPIVFILHKTVPALVPVKSYNFLNFYALILVYKDNVFIPKSMPTIKDNSVGTSSCPFAGRVIADKDGGAIGFTWTTKGTVFTIDNDWNVIANGTSFGWIDKNGQIRKGLKGNPNETLSMGTIIGKVANDNFYVNNEKVGDLVNW